MDNEEFVEHGHAVAQGGSFAVAACKCGGRVSCQGRVLATAKCMACGEPWDGVTFVEMG
jgi:hypothetical protein